MKKTLLKIILLIAILSFALYGCQKPQNKQRYPKNPIATKQTSELSFDQQEATSDPFNDPKGPFYHNVYKATSNDGQNFKKTGGVVLQKASVPDAVKMKNGRLFIYAVDGGGRSLSGLMVAISKDNGKTFQQGSAQFGSQKYGVADPQAVLTDNGKIRLYYVQFPEKKPPLDGTGKPIPTGDNMQIKSAISSDGINFKEEAGSRYETPEIVTDPDVVKIGNKWFMYLSKGQENIAFSSSDGKEFKEEKSIRTDGSVSKTVAIGNGKYRQFFCKDGISSAVTTDGLNFTNEGVSLIAKQGVIICDPTPVKVGNEWLMFYKVQDATEEAFPPPKPPE